MTTLLNQIECPGNTREEHFAVNPQTKTTKNLSIQEIPTKMLAEQHIQEDCGFIPTPKDYLFMLTNNPPKWMLSVGKKTTTTKLEIK
ncbi:MAG: hypothetical protein EB120_04380 [Proteobacteria bacterium]|nr:hypothetical protein [Pseudomonadota bacterium]